MLERLNTKEGRNVGLLLTGCLRRVNGTDTRALATASLKDCGRVGRGGSSLLSDEGDLHCSGTLGALQVR